MTINTLESTLKKPVAKNYFPFHHLDSAINTQTSFIDHSYLQNHFINNMMGTTISQAHMNFFDMPEYLQFILQHLDNGILVQDSFGAFLYCNPSASLLLGFESSFEMIQHLINTPDIFHEGYLYKDTTGRIIHAGQWPWEKISSENPQCNLMVNMYTNDTFIRRIHIHSYLTQTEEKRDKLIISNISDRSNSALLEKQKDEFMSLASHELKTPITSMKVFTQALLRTFEKENDPKSTYYLSKIDGQLNKLTMLVKEMLEVSRLQTGRMQLHQELFPIDSLIQEVCEQMQFTTNDHTIVCLGSAQAKLYADKERIGQVLVNLISNAIKFSPSDTKVYVQSEIKDNTVIIQVEDEGIGISEERQVYIFNRFAKNDDATESTFPGMGVGLYIASEIIKRHNGTVIVSSKKDKGSVFTVTLPISYL